MKFIIQDSQLEVFELFDNSSRICLKRPLEVDLATSSNDALFTLDLAPLSQEDIDEIPKYAKVKNKLEKKLHFKNWKFFVHNKKYFINYLINYLEV